MSEPREPLHAVAVIGMAGRFPGAGSVAELWRNLRAGVESVPAVSDTASGKAGAPGGIDLFDADFFAIPPREAEILDPQHRLFLECAWEALEDAGYDPAGFAGSIGVYAGAASYDYAVRNLYSHPDLVASLGTFRIMIGNQSDYLPTRVSYKLDLRGPSVNVQTACSTSLVAVHSACESLLNCECDMALAGGVTVRLPHPGGYQYEEGGILSVDGRCRAFDARAQGTVFANGAGVVLLKRLADALADGDPVRAVLRGSAVNNDGSFKLGYTAPSVAGQAEVVATALAVAGVDPDSVSYVEAHGTGTPLGDPMEVEALAQVFRARTGRRGFCALGSVKTNLGHLETAAGVTGLIKTVLALEHGEIPPSLHFETPNPRIDFAATPFYVNARLAPWPRGAAPRRAGVSAFGIGGTNAHVIVEEAPAPAAAAAGLPAQLLILSARTPAALEAATERLAGHLREHPELDPADVAYTLQVGRRAFAHRRMAVGRSLLDFVQALERRETADGMAAGEPEGSAEVPAPEELARLAAEGDGSGLDRFLAGLGRRWLSGAAVDWRALYAGAPRRRVPLPTYPFERRRYWIDPPLLAPVAAAAEPVHGELPLAAQLTEIFREILGFPEIGPHDAFADLDGDSVSALQLVVRARERGIGFSVDDVLLHQTPARLAAFLGARTAPAPEEAARGAELMAAGDPGALQRLLDKKRMQGNGRGDLR
jgi:acyl transferase domain-containing protein